MDRCELRFTNMTLANLSGARLTSSELTHALLVGTNIEGAFLSGAQVYGISAWDLKGEPADQLDLIITPRPPPDVPRVTVDDLRVAQLIYVMLSNGEIRNVIDTVASKAVVVLGRFGEHLPVLNAVRDELRRRNYLPIVFDFEQPGTRDLTETITTLAHLARFVIADLSDPRSVPHELMATIPNLPSVAFQPIVLETDSPFATFEHWRRYPWVMPVFRYRDLDHLVASLEESLIGPTEEKVKALRQEIQASAPPARAATSVRAAKAATFGRPPVPPAWLEDARRQLRPASKSPLSPQQQTRLRQVLIQPGPSAIGSRPPAEHVFLGNCYLEVSDCLGAIAEFSAAIGLDPQLAEAYFNRARAYHQLGRLDRAIEDNTRAAALRPAFPEAYYNRGIAYRVQGDLSLAIADFSKVIGSDPEPAKGYDARGFVHHLAGRYEAAITDYDEALRLDPRRAETYFARGLAFEQAGDAAKALGDYQAGMDLVGENADFLQAQARVLGKLGASDEAVRIFTRVLELNPSSGEAYHGRGLARRDLGELEAAVQDYGRAIELLADKADPYADRGFALSAQGRYSEAIADYDRAIGLNAENINGLYNRACAFSLSKTAGSILTDLQTVFKLDPTLMEHARTDAELEWARANIAALRDLLRT
jgi:tetratricopeptide (TPR) repeat protein